jgi:AraC-like DNA-binding protein
MMHEPYQPAWFDCAQFPAAQRVDAFRSAFAGMMGGIAVEPHTVPGRPFAGRIVHCALPGALLATCFGVAARFRRGDGDTTERAGEVLLLRPVGGPMPVRQGGRELVIAPGDAALLSLAAPFEYDAAATSRVDHLRISAPAVARAARPDGALLRPASASDNRLALLAHYAGAVLQGMILLETERRARLAGNHIRDLASVLFGLDDMYERAAAPASRLATLKEHIASELSRRDLSVESVAAAHGITPRYVQKLFEAEGATFTAYVLEQRLEAARRMLERRREAGAVRSISAIAFEAGFGDLSYFNRSFRRRFGVPPSQFRKATEGER